MGLSTIDRQIHASLANKIAFGQSKHLDKVGQKFGAMNYGIYSHETYHTYRKVGEEYAKWLVEKQGVKRYAILQKTEDYASQYIQERLEQGISVYTLKMERAALGKIYGHKLDIPLPTRDKKDITRSREPRKMDKHISPTGKYRDVYTFAQSTGCRRCDLMSAKADCLREINGHLYIQVKQSKGGRDRLSPVLPGKEQAIREIVEKAKSEGRERLFDHIPKEMDVHGERRSYAQELYREVAQDKEYRDSIVRAYRPRREDVASSVYKDRDGNVYARDDVYVVTQALGHNRLEVTVSHYLK